RLRALAGDRRGGVHGALDAAHGPGLALARVRRVGPVLTTARLALRELQPRDLDFVAAMLGDAETMRFYPKPYTREESAEWIDRQRRRYRNDGYALWLVSLRATGEPVGQVGVIRQQVD